MATIESKAVAELNGNIEAETQGIGYTIKLREVNINKILKEY